MGIPMILEGPKDGNKVEIQIIKDIVKKGIHIINWLWKPRTTEEKYEDAVDEQYKPILEDPEEVGYEQQRRKEILEYYDKEKFIEQVENKQIEIKQELWNQDYLPGTKKTNEILIEKTKSEDPWERKAAIIMCKQQNIKYKDKKYNQVNFEPEPVEYQNQPFKEIQKTSEELVNEFEQEQKIKKEEPVYEESSDIVTSITFDTNGVWIKEDEELEGWVTGYEWKKGGEMSQDTLRRQTKRDFGEIPTRQRFITSTKGEITVDFYSAIIRTQVRHKGFKRVTFAEFENLLKGKVYKNQLMNEEYIAVSRRILRVLEREYSKILPGINNIETRKIDQQIQLEWELNKEHSEYKQKQRNKEAQRVSDKKLLN